VIDNHNTALIEFDTSGSVVRKIDLPGTGTLDPLVGVEPDGRNLAIDASGNVWYASARGRTECWSKPLLSRRVPSMHRIQDRSFLLTNKVRSFRLGWPA